MKRNNQKQRGFTIIELMIATTIFSLVLMICLAAIMTITRMYYQGTLQARTQNRTREIVDEIADELRYQPGDVVVNDTDPLLGEIENNQGEIGSVDPEALDDYYGQYCVGSVRYQYLLGFKTQSDAQRASGPLDDREARGTLVRSNDCSLSGDLDADEVAAALINDESVNSMLDENMRLLEFQITPSGGDSGRYTVTVTIAYGDDDLIGYENGNFACKPDNVARAYCAVSRLEVIVTRRF